MPDPHADLNERSQIIVWGRPDSSAVSRVMWTIAELDLPCQRIDWGGPFGGNDDPAHRARNPAGTIPAIELPDGRTLWESQAIVRYLCTVYAAGDMIPLEPFERAQAEAIMDWSPAFARAVSAVRTAYKHTDASIDSCSEAISLLKPQLEMLSHILGDKSFLAGQSLGVADFALGGWIHRLIRCPEELELGIPSNIRNYYARLCIRKPFEYHISTQVSAGLQRIGG